MSVNILGACFNAECSMLKAKCSSVAFGVMLLALNKPAEALEAYEVNVKGHPGRFNGIYGAAKAAVQSGNKEKARFYYKQLLELTKTSNSDRVEIIEAKSYVSKIAI